MATQNATPAQRLVTAKDITWETFEGETQGFIDIGADTYEINITARVRPSMWTTGTNERTWSVDYYGGADIALGYAEGLRNSKREAIKALNDHLAAKASTADE